MLLQAKKNCQIMFLLKKKDVTTGSYCNGFTNKSATIKYIFFTWLPPHIVTNS